MSELSGGIEKNPIPRTPEKPRNYVVMGVSGCGKTTVAMMLAGITGYVYAEGDDFHTMAAREQMGNGIPLTDEDRWPWLDSIRRWTDAENEVGHSTVVPCSALRRVYREKLAESQGDTFFIHVAPPREILEERLAARKNHYMKPGLLNSQYDTLEELEDDEPGITVRSEGEPMEVLHEVLGKLNELAQANEQES